jgi:DNA topoisomerase-1
VERVANRLGNTKAVCRKSYIHPAIFESYQDGSMMEMIASRVRKVARAVARLTEAETAVAQLLQRRLTKGMKRKAS